MKREGIYRAANRYGRGFRGVIIMSDDFYQSLIFGAVTGIAPRIVLLAELTVLAAFGVVVSLHRFLLVPVVWFDKRYLFIF